MPVNNRRHGVHPWTAVYEDITRGLDTEGERRVGTMQARKAIQTTDTQSLKTDGRKQCRLSITMIRIPFSRISSSISPSIPEPKPPHSLVKCRAHLISLAMNTIMTCSTAKVNFAKCHTFSNPPNIFPLKSQPYGTILHNSMLCIITVTILIEYRFTAISKYV